MVNELSRLLMPLKRRLCLLVDRAVMRIVSDSKARQQLQIQTLANETASDVERWQNYGHTSVPPIGAEALTLAIGGNRSNLVVICAEDKAVRLKDLQPGDSALYHLEGHFFKLTKNKTGELVADELNIIVSRVNITAIESVVITTPKATFSGDVEIGGNCYVAGTVTGEQGGTFKEISAETHSHQGNGPGNMTSGPQ